MISESENEKNDLIRNSVKEIYTLLKEKNKELDEIQSNCIHPKLKLKDIHPSNLSDIRKCCDVCEKILGYPSQDELDKWINICKK